MGKTTGMFGGMLHVVRKLPGKSILGYFAIYLRILCQVTLLRNTECLFGSLEGCSISDY